MQQTAFSRRRLTSHNVIVILFMILVMITLSASLGKTISMMVAGEERKEAEPKQEDPTVSSSLSPSHQTSSALTSNATQHSPPSFSSFGMVVENAVMCGVCYNLLSNSLVQVQTYMRAKGVKSVSMEEVDELLEGICSPHHVAGAWIRKMRFALEKDNENVTDSPIHLELKEHLTYHVRCKKTCQTVTNVCEYLSEEQTVFQNIRKDIVHAVNVNKTAIDDVELHKQMRAVYCDPLFECNSLDTLVGRMTKMLNQRPNSKLRRDIEEDTVEYVNNEEDKEDLFSRNEGLLTQLNEEDVERLRVSAQEGFYQFMEDMMDRKELEDKEKAEKEARENITNKIEGNTLESPAASNAEPVGNDDL